MRHPSKARKTFSKYVMRIEDRADTAQQVTGEDRDLAFRTSRDTQPSNGDAANRPPNAVERRKKMIAKIHRHSTPEAFIIDKSSMASAVREAIARSMNRAIQMYSSSPQSAARLA